MLRNALRRPGWGTCAMFDFLKISSKKPAKRPAVLRSQPTKSQSKGTVKIDRYGFHVREMNSKGFILKPYDKELIIAGQSLRIKINDIGDQDEYTVRPETAVKMRRAE